MSREHRIRARSQANRGIACYWLNIYTTAGTIAETGRDPSFNQEESFLSTGRRIKLGYGGNEVTVYVPATLHPTRLAENIVISISDPHSTGIGIPAEQGSRKHTSKSTKQDK